MTDLTAVKDRLVALESKVAADRASRSISQRDYDSAVGKLKEQFGVDSLEEAEKLKVQLDSELADQIKAAEALLTELEKESEG